MSLIASALVGGGLSMASNLAGTMLSNKYARDAESRERDYNHPAAQMARMREAGLNPNLIYGQIGTGNISARSQPAHFDNPAAAAAESMHAYANARMLSGQLAQQRQDLLNSKDQGELIRAQTNAINQGLDIKGPDANFSRWLIDFYNKHPTLATGIHGARVIAPIVAGVGMGAYGLKKTFSPVKAHKVVKPPPLPKTPKIPKHLRGGFKYNSKYISPRGSISSSNPIHLFQRQEGYHY